LYYKTQFLQVVLNIIPHAGATIQGDKLMYITSDAGYDTNAYTFTIEGGTVSLEYADIQTTPSGIDKDSFTFNGNIITFGTYHYENEGQGTLKII
jgi:hypothetical protein